jgi:pathogenesis-related protein 1
MDCNGFTRAGAAGTLAVLLLVAGCASQSPAPVTPAPAKPASQPKPAAPPPKPAAAKPAPPPVPAKPAEPAPKVEAPAGKAAGSKMSAADAKALVDHHNKARVAVGVKPLKWSATLAANAQKWADHLASTTCQMQHSSDGVYGENLYRGTAGHFSASDASKAWEAEKKDYDGPLTRSNLKAVGHYTQMVWRETTRIGCGEVTCAKNLLVVCNYDPPGNYLGRKGY